MDFQWYLDRRAQKARKLRLNIVQIARDECFISVRAYTYIAPLEL